jgi:hypothetical protein
MKGIILLTASVLIATCATCVAQSERLGTRLDNRIGGRLIQGAPPPVQGTYGPDPYIAPGSVSPFANSPIVPLRSAPIPDNAATYRGPFPSTPLNPEGAGVPQLSSPSVKQEDAALPRAPTEDREVHTNASESGIQNKSVSKLGEAPSAHKVKEGSTHERPLTARKSAPPPCLNGKTRVEDGSCTGTLRPK